MFHGGLFLLRVWQWKIYWNNARIKTETIAYVKRFSDTKCDTSSDTKSDTPFHLLPILRMVSPREHHQLGLFDLRHLEFLQQQACEVFGRTQLVRFNLANGDLGAADLG